MTDNYQKRYWVYRGYYDQLLKNLNEDMDSFLTGSVPTPYTMTFNAIFTLLQLRNEDYASGRPSRMIFKNALRARAFCHKLNIGTMEAELPPSYDDNCPTQVCEEGGGGSVVTADGIGNMQMRPNDNIEIKPNRISSK